MWINCQSTPACIYRKSVSVTKDSWQIWKHHIYLQNKHRSYNPPSLITYYFLCPLEVLQTAYPSYFLFSVISKLNTMKRRKTFFLLCLLNSQKGALLSVTMLHQFYTKVQEKKAMLFFFWGKPNKHQNFVLIQLKK